MASVSLTEVLTGTALLLVALAARPLVGMNLWLWRKAGAAGSARAWEKRLGWWVPTVRVVSALLALAFLAMGLGMFRSG